MFKFNQIFTQFVTPSKLLKQNTIKNQFSQFFSSRNLTNKLKKRFSQEEFSEFFYPQSKLLFRDGLCTLYRYTRGKTVFNGVFLITGIFGLLGFYSLKKIYHFSERNMFSIIFYSICTYFFFKNAYKLLDTYS
jgi:hypothetical protein